ncbi:hypothetical protein B0H19DRAFT_1077804 [Mycena capillaripes]|nr:hypothetical protein B0H19DRAFT_1077804 [Mycena capillaripes]
MAELLYSQVVNPAPAVESGSMARTSGSSQPVLSQDADYGLLGPDMNSSNAQWTPVTRKTARSHLNYVSSTSHINESVVISTVSLATREMSEAQLFAVARRYESLGREAYAAARQRSSMPEQNISHKVSSVVPHESVIDLDGAIRATEPASQPHSPFRGSNISWEGQGTGSPGDPRNWGDVNFTEEFSDAELEAQRATLENFEEINRVIKREELTPTGLFDGVPNTNIHDERRAQPVVSREPSHKRGGEVSSQTVPKKIAKPGKDGSNLRQSEETSKPKATPAFNQAENAVKNSVLRNVNQDEWKGSSRKPSGRGSVAHAAAETMIQQDPSICRGDHTIFIRAFG